MKSLIWTIWNRWIHRERRVMVAQGRVKEGWLLSGHKGWPCLGARQRWWCTCSKCTDPTELGHTFVIVQSLCRVQLFVTSWVAVHQASLSFTISQSLPKFISIESLMPSNHLLLCRQLLLPSIFPSIRVFTNESSSGHMAKVLALQLQHQYFQLIFRTDFLYVWLVWTPCCPRDSQESSLVPQFKGINSLALSLFYCPALISIPDYWKNHNFDYTDLC